MAAKKGKKPVETPLRSLSWIVRHAPKFVRRDPGGQEARLAAASAITEAGVVDLIDAYLLGAKKSRDTIDRYLEPVWASLKAIVGKP